MPGSRQYGCSLKWANCLQSLLLIDCVSSEKNMTNKGDVQFTYNYKCQIYQLPKNQSERQNWCDVLLPLEMFVVDVDSFSICETHYSADPPLIKLLDGFQQPAIPPSMFNAPASCLPGAKPAPRLGDS